MRPPEERRERLSLNRKRIGERRVVAGERHEGSGRGPAREMARAPGGLVNDA
jgi:hypothetical protein